MIRRPPRSTLFPYTSSSDLIKDFTPIAMVGGTPNVLVVHPSVPVQTLDRKSTRLNSSHPSISYAVFCLKKKKRPVAEARDRVVGRLPRSRVSLDGCPCSILY